MNCINIVKNLMAIILYSIAYVLIDGDIFTNLIIGLLFIFGNKIQDTKFD